MATVVDTIGYDIFDFLVSPTERICIIIKYSLTQNVMPSLYI